VFSTLGNDITDHTDIIFSLGKNIPVTIKIFNMAGRHIRDLVVQESYSAGENAVSWNGTNEAGARCVSGLYIICVMANGKKEFKTVAIVNN
jgi:flagellar hook assembly protein FlgD